MLLIALVHGGSSSSPHVTGLVGVNSLHRVGKIHATSNEREVCDRCRYRRTHQHDDKTFVAGVLDGLGPQRDQVYKRATNTLVMSRLSIAKPVNPPLPLERLPYLFWRQGGIDVADAPVG